MNQWLAIINPVSGNSKGGKDWDGISRLLQEVGIDFEAHHTDYPFHTRLILKDGLKRGFRKVMLVGGDGTYHEIVNVLMEQTIVPSTEVMFAMLPAGTGNDWNRTMLASKNYQEIIHLMKTEKTLLQDVGWATFVNEGKEEKRFFLNVAGLGFDAYVAEKYLKNSKGAGVVSYLIGLLRGLVTYRNPTLKINIEDQEFEKTSIFMGVGICKYFGGGMKIVPDAIPNDGLLDITVAGDFGKLQVAGQLMNLYKGTFTKHKKVSQHRSTQVSVTSQEPVFIQMDGEVVGHTPVQFGIVPQCMRVVASPDLPFFEHCIERQASWRNAKRATD